MPSETLSDMSGLQIAGLCGAGLYMMTYSLLSTRVLTGDSALYFALNLCAATLVLLSLGQAFNAATLVIQTFWIVTSVISILVRIRRKPV